MAAKPLFVRLFLPYLLLTLLTAAALIIFLLTAGRRDDLRRLEASLTERLTLLEPLVPEHPAQSAADEVERFVSDAARRGGLRLTLILTNGRVAAESDTLISIFPHLNSRPEVARALAGNIGVNRRHDQIFNRDMLFVAIPVLRGGKLVAVLRGAESLAELRASLETRLAMLSGLLALLIAVGTLLLYVVTRVVSRPVLELTGGIQDFTRGKLGTRSPGFSARELDSLGRELNLMAATLDSRIRKLELRHEEREAVLSSMIEGVLAVDHRARVIMINAAAEKLLQVDRERVAGRLLEEAVRNTDVQRFVQLALQTGAPVEREFIRYDVQDQILQLRGTPITAPAQTTPAGVVIVINDVTQMRKLERTRRDFAAHASHELKTPVTAIKGWVETLRDGALEDKQEAARFLEIIHRQTEYLSAIIDDLLSLTRIEAAAESRALAVEELTVGPILDDAVEAARPLARQRGQNIVVTGPPDLRAAINSFLIRQAVFNLLDNALKYSPEHTQVDLRFRTEASQLVIEVEDRGPGIPEPHLDRIFERFYRVEQSRSRKFGGTGLGLAIVKHAALAHGGSAEVQTTVGRGSTFSLRIPALPPSSAETVGG